MTPATSTMNVPGQTEGQHSVGRVLQNVEPNKKGGS